MANNGENISQATVNEELEEQASAVLSEILPILVNRLERAGFAKWYRLNGQLEDLLHNAAYLFLAHCRKNKTIPTEPLNYIVRIARNEAYAKYRVSKNLPLDLAVPIPENAYATDDQGEKAATEEYAPEQLELIRIAVEMLPKRQREAYELRNANPGATDRELGQRMGISEDGFRKQFNRAFERLLALIKSQ